jgi:hypothetical protein
MAHFCKVDDGTVTDLIVVDNDDCGGGDFPDSEPIGQAFIAALAAGDPRLEGTWLQTSYNDNFRGRLGQIGFIYDVDADVFIAPDGFDPEPVEEVPPITVDELEDIADAGDETDV